jgi:hypothetical protein
LTPEPSTTEAPCEIRLCPSDGFVLTGVDNRGCGGTCTSTNDVVAEGAVCSSGSLSPQFQFTKKCQPGFACKPMSSLPGAPAMLGAPSICKSAKCECSGKSHKVSMNDGNFSFRGQDIGFACHKWGFTDSKSWCYVEDGVCPDESAVSAISNKRFSEMVCDGVPDISLTTTTTPYEPTIHIDTTGVNHGDDIDFSQLKSTTGSPTAIWNSCPKLRGFVFYKNDLKWSRLEKNQQHQQANSTHYLCCNTNQIKDQSVVLPQIPEGCGDLSTTPYFDYSQAQFDNVWRKKPMRCGKLYDSNDELVGELKCDFIVTDFCSDASIKATNKNQLGFCLRQGTKIISSTRIQKSDAIDKDLKESCGIEKKRVIRRAFFRRVRIQLITKNHGSCKNGLQCTNNVCMPSYSFSPEYEFVRCGTMYDKNNTLRILSSHNCSDDSNCFGITNRKIVDSSQLGFCIPNEYKTPITTIMHESFLVSDNGKCGDVWFQTMKIECNVVSREVVNEQRKCPEFSFCENDVCIVSAV